MDRILRQVRIGDVALHATDDERPGKRAAAAVFDHVAQSIDRRRFADNAVVERLACGAEFVDDTHRAVDRRTFLVGSDEQRNRSTMACVQGRESFDRNDECGQRRLHVGGTAPVEKPVAHRRHKRIRMPRLERTGRHHVGVSCEADQGTRVAEPCPEIADAVGGRRLAMKSKRPETRFQNILATRVVRRAGAARDQLAREVKRRRAGQ